MRISRAVARVQGAYESGSLSYPRTSSTVLAPETAALVAGLAARFGMEWRYPTTSVRAGHEALHSVGRLPALTDGVDRAALSSTDHVADRVARHWLRCGVDLVLEEPIIGALPAWAAELPWWRPTAATPAVLAVDELAPHVSAELVMYDADEIALRALLDANLGRPSSWPEHAERVAMEGWVDGGGLTPAGAACLMAAPNALRDLVGVHAIEAAFDADDKREDARPAQPPIDLVDRALAALPELRPAMHAALQRYAKSTTDGDSESVVTPIPPAPRDDEPRRRTRPLVRPDTEEEQSASSEHPETPAPNTPWHPTSSTAIPSPR